MPTVSVKQGWPLLIAFLAIVLGIGAVVGYISAPDDYARQLNMPPLVLPQTVSGILWVVLAAAFAVAGWRNWQIDSNSTAMRLWLAVLILSWWFAPALFIIRSPLLALAIVAAILVLMLWFVLRSWKAERVSFWLAAPGAVYVAYLTAMTAAVAALN